MSGRSKRVLVGGLTLLFAGVALLRAGIEKPEPSGTAMTNAAQAFLETLNPEQRKQASFGYNDAERLNWHFIPRVRKGLPLRDLEGKSLKAAHALIASSLSETGYDQTLRIMSLEEVLYVLEPGDRKTRRELRNPGKYFLSFFDTPSLTGKWGWRLEGHHVSLNFTVENGEVTASTPEFFGANPGTIEAGPGRTIRVLGAEEDMGRQILKLCTPEQRKVMHISSKAPNDLRGANKPQAEIDAAVGLPYSQMSDDQKKLVGALLAEYLRNMPDDVAAGRRKALEAAGLDKIQFAWWGDTERNQRHYYRLQGPTFIIEYNNTQNEANHVHSMWRDLRGDFGIAVK